MKVYLNHLFIFPHLT